MTLNDDLSCILSFLTNSFITSDETGMCEHILEENLISNTCNNSENEPDDIEETALNEIRHSPDIVPHMDFSGHRFRSNTAIRLDNMRLEKQKQSQVEHVFWKESNLMKENFNEDFQAYNIKNEHHSSLLSQQILEFKLSNNPYKIYSEFDGKKCDIGVKKLDIYLTMLPESNPLEVFVNVRAKIFQLIGLICWKYTEKNMGPSLKKVEDYCLCLVEDDGEVDSDFPPLDTNEFVSKFEFPKLALVEFVATNNQSSNSLNKYNNSDITAQDPISKDIEEVENNYNSFIVQQMHRFRPKTTVKLTINKSQLIISSKQFSHFIRYSDITNCFIHHRKSTNQVILRLLYNYNDKSIQKDFDCDTVAACKIEANIIAKLKNS